MSKLPAVAITLLPLILVSQFAEGRTSGETEPQPQARLLLAQASDPFELAFWESIKDSDNPADYEAYLEAFPDGRFVPLARSRAASLRGENVEPPPAESGTSVATEESTGIEEMDATYVVLERANVREAPTATSRRIARLSPGSEIRVTGKIAGKNWYRIAAEGVETGYIIGNVIRRSLGVSKATEPTAPPGTVTAAPAPASPQGPVVDIRRSARLRAAPTATSERLLRLAKGDSVTVLGRVGDTGWYYIAALEGTRGFVHRSYLTVSALDVPEVNADGQPVAATTVAAADPRPAAPPSPAPTAPRIEPKTPAPAAQPPPVPTEVARARPRPGSASPALEPPRPAPSASPAPEATPPPAAREPSTQPSTRIAKLEPPASPVPPPAAPASIAAELEAAFRDCDVCPEMIPLAPGEFVMGSSKSDPTERPERPVALARGYAIGRYEVTMGEWRACVEAGGCKYRPNNLATAPDRAPIGNVSWTDAVDYTRWLQARTGKPYRLPTEAEWEYAARGGTRTRFWWGNEPGSNQANCRDCGGEWNRRNPATVGSYEANPFGLHDTSGSLWEWVSDCWHGDFTKAPTDGSTWDRPDCRVRVLRGGSWRNNSSYVHSSSRFKYDADVRYLVNGLRVARPLD